MKKFTTLMALTLVSAVSWGANVAGEWKGEIEKATRYGNLQKIVANFKLAQSGETVTGTAGQSGAEFKIEEGVAKNGQVSLKLNTGSSVALVQLTQTGETMTGTLTLDSGQQVPLKLQRKQ